MESVISIRSIGEKNPNERSQQFDTSPIIEIERLKFQHGRKAIDIFVWRPVYTLAARVHARSLLSNVMEKVMTHIHTIKIARCNMTTTTIATTTTMMMMMMMMI